MSNLMPTDIKYYVYTNKGATPLSNTWGALISVLDSCLVTGYSSQTVSLKEITGNVLKLTYPDDHKYLAGQVIKISGANQTEYNREFRISIVPSSTTIHIDITPELAAKGISGTLSTVLPSLGWTSEFSEPGKRAYRNADTTDSSRPYLRVVDELDPLWNSSYAKYAKVGVVDSMTDANTIVGVQTPFDASNPDKNWKATGPSGTQNVVNGWAKWYYSRINDVYVLNYYDSEGTTDANKRWVVIGNKDWIYILPSQIVSQYCNVYFYGKIVNEDNTLYYGLNSTLFSNTAYDCRDTCSVTSLSSDAFGFLIHDPTTIKTNVLSTTRFLGVLPSSVNPRFENIESHFVYSDLLISQMIGSKMYRSVLPSLKWCLNPFNSSYDVKVLEEQGKMFLIKTVHATYLQTGAGVESPMLVAFDLLGTA